MAFRFFLAAAAASTAAASGGTRPKDVVLLQRQMTSTKKLPSAASKLQGSFEPEANAHSIESNPSVRPVLPQPLVLLSANRSKPPTVAEADMGDYPGYTGELKVRGMVLITSMHEDVHRLSLSWALEGADKLCNEDTNNPAKNACGIHIHEGVLCSDAKLVGGHYSHGMTEDPWANFTYTASDSGKSEGGNSVRTGLSLADVIAHSMVVHDHTGKRIACGLIVEESGARFAPMSLALILGLLARSFLS